MSEVDEWRRRMQELLELDGYSVQADAHGDAAFDPTCLFDLAVVDIDLHARPVVSVLAALRVHSSRPILAVSHDGRRERVVLEVYAAGVDQLVVGERSHELRARARALLRRTPPQLCGSAYPAGVPVITLDRDTATATVAGKPLELAPREADLLAALLARPGRVVSRDQLGGARRSRQMDHALDALVRGLRAKLEAAEGRRRIVAVRGVGFRLELDPGPVTDLLPLATAG